jgi:hypothetical protein
VQFTSFPKFDADTTETVFITIWIRSPFWIAQTIGVVIPSPNLSPLDVIMGIEICTANDYKDIGDVYHTVDDVSNTSAITKSNFHLIQFVVKKCQRPAKKRTRVVTATKTMETIHN